MGDSSLLLWTDPIESLVAFNDDYVRRGWRLTSVPIRMERPQAGAEFRIPASFVQIQALAMSETR